MAEDFGGAPPADPAANLRADPSFRAALDGTEGWHAQQRAQQQISAQFRAAYPDDADDAAPTPPYSAATSPRPAMRSGVDPAALQRDPGFRQRLQSDDWKTRERAQAQLSAAHAAYAGDPEHIAPPARPGPSHDDRGVPRDPARYHLTAAVAGEADLAAAVRETCHDLKMPTAEAIVFSRAIERLASHEPPGPDTLQAQSDGLLDLVTQQEFDRASAAWRRLEAGDAALATFLETLGATTDPEFVRLLARTSS